jgi:hypothetical protein
MTGEYKHKIRQIQAQSKGYIPPKSIVTKMIDQHQKMALEPA